MKEITNLQNYLDVINQQCKSLNMLSVEYDSLQENDKFKVKKCINHLVDISNILSTLDMWED